VLYAHISTILALTFSQAPRGLSAEEKRVKLLEIFHETVCLFFLERLSHTQHRAEGLLSGDVYGNPLSQSCVFNDRATAKGAGEAWPQNERDR
jgi:hypothetical protein